MWCSKTIFAWWVRRQPTKQTSLEVEMDRNAVGTAKVVGLEEGESFWQPVPANGFVRNLLNTRTCGADAQFSIGTQTVAPGCYIREHMHDRHEEIIHVIEGNGIARIDGIEYLVPRGSSVFIGRNRKHHFLNWTTEPFTFLWIMLPGGLDDFFAAIGRPRSPGQPAPEPFPRPANIAEIEASTVFGRPNFVLAKLDFGVYLEITSRHGQAEHLALGHCISRLVFGAEMTWSRQRSSSMRSTVARDPGSSLPTSASRESGRLRVLILWSCEARYGPCHRRRWQIY
jgi:quercetin dioxygenase-like cupin family protein